MAYNTKQKELILSKIICINKVFTVKDIYEQVKDQCGLTTVYRVIDKLVEEKRIVKYIKDNETYYQFLSECNEINHFYLRCDECGSLIHVDCDCIDDLTTHIIREHQFVLNKENVIINGVCANCLKKAMK